MTNGASSVGIVSGRSFVSYKYKPACTGDFEVPDEGEVHNEDEVPDEDEVPNEDEVPVPVVVLLLLVQVCCISTLELSLTTNPLASTKLHGLKF